jgi:hypothetical protein
MNDKAASKDFQAPRTNMKLWDSVMETDPSYTKQFKKGGGFSGTSPNAAYLAMKATEKFGPCGIGWGYSVISEELVQGAPIVHEKTPPCNEIIHKVLLKLWYVLDGTKGELCHFGQTTFVGKNKYGPFTDEEAPKKSITDAMTKCLSLLGFSADIHLGMYDDNKYISDVRTRKESENKALQTMQLHDCLENLTAAAKQGYTVFKEEWMEWPKSVHNMISDAQVAHLQSLCKQADENKAA